MVVMVGTVAVIAKEFLELCENILYFYTVSINLVNLRK